jgi:perosamine synthetase
MKPIHHTFGPHITLPYLLESWGLLLRPWKWRKGYDREKLRSSIQYWFDAKCFLFSSGREGMLGLLRSLDFETGSEIIVQGYTCVALPNAIHAAGYTPIFVDIDPATLNIHSGDLEKKITARTKAIICQHTFGIIADTQNLREICDKHHIVLIEDLAHVLPDVSGPDSLGINADYMMLSFGRDKAISGICGGAIVSRHDIVSDELEEEEQRAKEMSLWSTFRILLYPSIYAIARTIYNIGLGKIMLVVSRKLTLLLPIINAKEKKGTQSPILKKMPNACAALAGRELKNMHSINNHRRVLTKLYIEAAEKYHWDIPGSISPDFPLQKFPILTEDADAMRIALKKHNIYLDDGWTGSAVCPRSVQLSTTGYSEGSCPKAEEIAASIVTLPTHITMTMTQAKRLISHLQS